MASYPYTDLEGPQTDPAKIEQSMRMMNERMRDKPTGTSYFLQVTDSSAGAMEMGKYVNQELSQNSDYFNSLNKMMQCVEKNVHLTDPVQQERVCATEFKNLRLMAYKNKLLYSEVNKRFFMREL